MTDTPARVLCVDDEKSILSALRRVFLDEPWEVSFASGGEEGLELVRAETFDLILSDFRMPGMDGVTFLREARKIQPDCIRIVLSGYADINLVVTALNEGEIYRFIPKPWNDDELLHNLRKAIDHYRLDLENRRLTEELRDLNVGLERKVVERTRELLEKNRALRFAQLILEVLPMPVLGVDYSGVVTFANAKARGLLGGEEGDLVDARAPAVFEPELTGAIQRAQRSEDEAHHVMPMVLDGVAVGTIILANGEETRDLETSEPRQAVSWSVPPIGVFDE